MSKVPIGQEDFREKHPNCFKGSAMLGEQSVDQIRDRKLYNLANEIFNLWETKGRTAALVWAGVNMTDQERIDAKPYVHMVFEKHGYKRKGTHVSM